jgi:hypothetical protein
MKISLPADGLLALQRLYTMNLFICNLFVYAVDSVSIASIERRIDE